VEQTKSKLCAPFDSAVDRGVTLIETAPAYGFGKSEEIIGEVLKRKGRIGVRHFLKDPSVQNSWDLLPVMSFMEKRVLRPSAITYWTSKVAAILL
jgi:predicted aldo/keto reductase-like oxidoreductase